MRLYVMRHGPAEDRPASGRDADRRLTLPGREIVERAARKLLEVRGGPVPRIVSSPLLRARETAALVWAIAGEPARPVELHEDLSTEADIPVDLARVAAQGNVDSLLVGHNPNVEALVREITRPSPRFVGFRTATIVEVVGASADDLGSWSLAVVFDAHNP
jgi:phosphohistidine phosphatase